MTSPKDPPAAVDYWTFVDHAATTLPKLHPGADVTANQVLLALNRTSALVTRHLESTVHRPHGNSWATYRILFVIWMHGPLTTNHLAHLSGTTKAGISNLTGPLVERGFLEKRPSPHDGRSRVLALTDAGHTHISEMFAEQNRAESRWSATLTPIERDLLLALLQKLNASEPAHEARSDPPH